MYIRFLSDTPVFSDAEYCEPNIEDAYMLYLYNADASIDILGR